MPGNGRVLCLGRDSGKGAAHECPFTIGASFPSNEAQAAAELLEAEQLIHLTPTLTADELPSEFEEILEVQVLGYRERLIWLHGGGRQRVLDPVWTLVPKDSSETTSERRTTP
jgi:hypothetical protein